MEAECDVRAGPYDGIGPGATEVGGRERESSCLPFSVVATAEELPLTARDRGKASGSITDPFKDEGAR